jgi:ribosomal protein S18 acetylase RimI-like enzyme
VSCSLRPVGRAQRARLERLTAAAGLFRPDEVAIAVELLDDSLAGDDDYRFLGAYAGQELIGYACWGPTPGTAGTYDLYWIVVDPAWQRKRVGTQLLGEVETRLRTDHGRLIVVETSARPEYATTRAFYERNGYTRAARIPDYYAPGDDLIIYLKDLRDGVLAGAAS